MLAGARHPHSVHVARSSCGMHPAVGDIWLWCGGGEVAAPSPSPATQLRDSQSTPRHTKSVNQQTSTYAFLVICKNEERGEGQMYGVIGLLERIMKGKSVGKGVKQGIRNRVIFPTVCYMHQRHRSGM